MNDNINWATTDKKKENNFRTQRKTYNKNTMPLIAAN